MSGLALEWVGDRGRFAELRAEWDELLVRSGAALFNSWEWLYPWCERVAPRARLRILLVRDSEGRLVGALPLVREREGPARKLSFIAGRGVGSDDLDILVDRGVGAAVLDAMAEALVREEGWDVLQLSDVPQGQTAAMGLVERLESDEVSNTSSSPHAGHRQERRRYRCPVISFPPGTTWPELLSRSGRRDNVRRRLTWLRAQPGYVVRCIRDTVDAAVGIRSFLDLHARRWAALGGSQGIRGPWVEAFHRDAAWFLAERGSLRLFLLELGGRPVAAVYGMVHLGAFLFYQSGADPEFAGRSVGLVLLAESIRAALEEGLGRYEFLHGEEPYKLEWADSMRTTVTHVVRRESLRARLAQLEETVDQRLRSAAGHVLPSRVVARLRASRRTAPIE
jgi:CelD/BcsL family acetyltransferase involved in cellulose biosynthesis